MPDEVSIKELIKVSFSYLYNPTATMHMDIKSYVLILNKYVLTTDLWGLAAYKDHLTRF